jgi:diguanylate cyclase (GGDEF)-like protein
MAMSATTIKFVKKDRSNPDPRDHDRDASRTAEAARPDLSNERSTAAAAGARDAAPGAAPSADTRIVEALEQEIATLRAVIDNFPGGITFLDADNKLAAYNDKFRSLLGLPDELFANGPPSLEAMFRFAAQRGDYGPDALEELVRAKLELARRRQAYAAERAGPNGTVIEVLSTPVEGGGYVTTFVDVTEEHRAERLLAEREQEARTQAGRLRITLGHMSQGLTLFDRDGRLLVWNDRFCEIYGVPRTLLKDNVGFIDVARHIESLEPIGSVQGDWQQTLSEDSVSILQFKDGRTVRIISTPVDGGAWVASHEDITEQARTEASVFEQATELARTNMRFEAALSNMSHGLCLFDAEERLVVYNKRFAELYKLPDHMVVAGMPMRDLIEQCIRHAAPCTTTVDELLDRIKSRLHDTCTTREGQIISISQVRTPDDGWLVTHEDITERENSAKQIRHLAFHDSLTGLANRARFKQEGELALSRASCCHEPIGVLLLDLDRFKPVNDMFGHAIGDKLLQVVARRMNETVGINDIVARLGGDEFAILMDRVSDPTEAASTLAATLVDTLSAPYVIDGHQVLIGVSIGIAISEHNKPAIEQVMHQADVALYKVKAAGRNGYMVYREDGPAKTVQQAHVAVELREAIEARRLSVFYQPIVSLDDRSVQGMEALIRWTHPTRGLLAASEFVSIAEETGLIVPLGEFVIEQACRDAAAWPVPITVSVNVSPIHLRRRSLRPTIINALRRTGLHPSRLELEITETVLLQQDLDVLSELKELQSLGVSIALDDFGTGFSSLSHLRIFAFDKVKIDRSFVAEMIDRTDSAAIISAVAGLARSLDIKTTAEGIETEDQAVLLRAAGCSLGQGYLFGRARPASETLRMLESSRSSAVA